MSNPSTFANRCFVALFAFGLSLLLLVSVAPMLHLTALVQQWDFLLLWVLSSLLLTLPMIYLEIGLARRGKTTVVHALSMLTRDADAQPTWRIIGWAGAFFISFLAGALLSTVPVQILPWVGESVPYTGLFALLMIAVLALSLLPRLVLLGLLLIGVLVAPFLVSSSFDFAQQFNLQWTLTSGQEWGLTVILALFATGFGMNVYWQNLLQADTSSSSATPTAWLIWLAFIVAGAVYVFLPINGVIANIALAALLIQFVRTQWLDRQFNSILAWAFSILFMLVWLFPVLHQGLFYVLIVVGLLLSLVYSIFAGWVMKASHLRKALNFSSEMSYNLWRVAVRIIIPLSIVAALIFTLLGAM
ncbi:MAG: hypothetical protein Q4D05_05335 [Acinetobacter sp.]|nr:hypothetical protein [Acinetobacter sp.]